MAGNRRRGSGRKNHPQCGHVGKGVECRRCIEADRLEYLASKGTPYVTNKKQDKKLHKTWTKQELLHESARLRAPAVRRPKAMVRVVVDQPDADSADSA